MHQYRNTTIYVADPQVGLWDATVNNPDPRLAALPAQPVGEYKDLVFSQLDEIWNHPTGGHFLNALTAAGKKQVIRYIGTGVPNDNSCRGASAGRKKIISELGTSGWGNARVELNMALHNWQAGAGLGVNASEWLADQVLRTPLYRWDPNQNVANSPLNPQNVQPLTPTWQKMVQMLAKSIDQYRAGTMSLSRSGETAELFDLIVWVLRTYLADGTGTACGICYTPLKTTLASGPRPPVAGLVHELVHSYYEALGCNLSNEGGNEQDSRYYELAAVGLPPFTTAPYSENACRQWIGWNAPRPYY